MTVNLLRLLPLLLLLSSPALAETVERKEPILIQGDAFTVSVMEPAGWLADSTAHASEKESLVLSRAGSYGGTARPAMRVLVSGKTDESTEEDLKFDMETYRRKFPGVQFRDIVVKHPEYRAFPKLFYVKGDFYEYVTYLNPGRTFTYLITVSMTIPTAEATSEDLQAYAALVASIRAVQSRPPVGQH